MTRLRRAISTPTSKPCPSEVLPRRSGVLSRQRIIETVSGTGYQLTPDESGALSKLRPREAVSGWKRRSCWLPLGSVRSRATASALVVVGAATLAGSIAFLGFLRASLVQSVDERFIVRLVAAD